MNPESHLRYNRERHADLLREARESELAAKFPADEVALYLSTLVSQDPDTWGELAELPETIEAETKS